MPFLFISQLPKPRALGAPDSFYAPTYPVATSKPQTGLNEIIKQYGTDLVRVQGCSPVLSQNPFQCKRIDTKFNKANSVLSISSDDNLCSVGEKRSYTMTMHSNFALKEALVRGHW